MPDVTLVEDWSSIPLDLPNEDGVPIARLDVDRDTRPLDVPVPRRHPLTGIVLPHCPIRLVERRGEGGAGLVYRATQIGTCRPLAIKVLRDDRPNYREGFFREVEVLRQIDSPWVVRFECSGMLHDGRPWFAMEYLEGCSLSRVIAARDAVDLVQVVRWLRQACNGLGAIHDAGWAHRDVKPSNLVQINDSGTERLKVIDLGIAVRFGVSPRALSGTPEYIAPEQAENKPVDLRSDIYALGCCAFELLTGKPVVSIKGAMAKINAHIEGIELSWPEPAAIPEPLKQIVERCLAHAPQARPANMYVLEDVLAQVERQLVQCRRSSRPLTGITEYDDVTAMVHGPVEAANDEPTTRWIIPRNVAALRRGPVHTDAQLRHQVRNALTRVVGLDRRTIFVSANAGTVHLTGTVPDHDTLGRVIDAVGSVRGVRGIRSHIAVSARSSKAQGLAARLRKRIEAAFPSTRATVTVLGYIAVIEGQVSSLAARRAIEDLARDMPGIGRVVNKLTVAPEHRSWNPCPIQPLPT